MKELFSLCLLAILFGTAFPAIIITQSIPGVIKISPTKYIIAIDQPHDLSSKLATSGSKKEQTVASGNHQKTTVVESSMNKTHKMEETAQISQILSIAELYDSKTPTNDAKVSGAVNITPDPTPSITTTTPTTSSSPSSSTTPFITASTTTQTPTTSSTDKKVTSSAPVIGLANPKSS